MGYCNKRFCFLFNFIFLILFSVSLFATDSYLLPESVVLDSNNTAKGGGAMNSPNNIFLLNPSLGFFSKRYQVEVGYNSPESFAFSVFDSKTTAFGGGVLFAKNKDIKSIKTNFSIPFANLFFFGINYNYYFGKQLDVSKEYFRSHTIDLGISVVLGKFLMLGVGAKDLFSFYGNDMNIKGTAQIELNLYKNIFFINSAFVYHFQHKKELIQNRRDKLKYTDFMTGAEFRYSIFVLSGGFYNSSFEKSMEFETTLKTLGFGIYKKDFAGIFGGFYFKKGYSSFSVNIVWEPQIK